MQKPKMKTTWETLGPKIAERTKANKNSNNSLTVKDLCLFDQLLGYLDLKVDDIKEASRTEPHDGNRKSSQCQQQGTKSEVIF